MHCTSLTTGLSPFWICNPTSRVFLVGRTSWRVGVLSVDRCLVASSKGFSSLQMSSRRSVSMLFRKRSSFRRRRMSCSFPDFRASLMDWSINSLVFHLVSTACFSDRSSSFCNLTHKEQKSRPTVSNYELHFPK